MGENLHRVWGQLSPREIEWISRSRGDLRPYNLIFLDIDVLIGLLDEHIITRVYNGPDYGKRMGHLIRHKIDGMQFGKRQLKRLRDKLKRAAHHG